MFRAHNIRDFLLPRAQLPLALLSHRRAGAWLTRDRLDDPICCAGTRHVWGTKAKLPVTHLAGGFAVFEAAFLCWSSLREK